MLVLLLPWGDTERELLCILATRLGRSSGVSVVSDVIQYLHETAGRIHQEVWDELSPVCR